MILPIIATTNSFVPAANPTVIAQNINPISLGSLMAVRKRMMERDPTRPRDKDKFFPINIMTMDVIIQIITIVTLKF